MESRLRLATGSFSWQKGAVEGKVAVSRGVEFQNLATKVVHRQLEIKRQPARNALQASAWESLSGKVPFVDDHSMPHRAEIIVSVEVVRLPRGDEVRRHILGQRVLQAESVHVRLVVNDIDQRLRRPGDSRV